MTVTSTGETVTVKNEFFWTGQGALAAITFSDGVSWTTQQVEQMVLDQESAAVGGSVYGYYRNDTLVAGLGDKYLNGEGGSDTYVYSSYDGNDVVDDPGNGASTLQLSDIASTDVSLSRPGGGNDLVITVNSTGKTVTVDNEFSSGSGSLKAITFSDGVSWNQTQIESLLNGGSGGGSNGVQFNLGDGHVTLNSGDTVVDMGTGITADNVLLQADGWGNLTVALRGDSSDFLTLNGDLANNSWGVSSNLRELEFSDGSTMNIGQPAAGQGSPINFTWVGSSSNTSLVGSNFGANIFDVASGGDSIQFGNTNSGGDGQNTIVFGTGDGHVTVSNVNNGTGMIQFGAGITADDVLLQADGWGNLTVALRGDSSDSITLNHDLSNNSWGVSSNLRELEFSDGTTLAIGQPAAGQGLPLTFTWAGSSSNTSLVGSNFGANVFDVASGGDSIQFGNTSSGGNGQNTIEFAEGDGNVNAWLNGGTGTIAFASGISAQDLYWQANGSGDLIVKIEGDDADSITIHNDLTQNSWGVSSGVNALTFADGSSVALGQPAAGQGSPLSFAWFGAPNTGITGSNFGSNTFELGGGTESFAGGTTSSGGNGNNTYLASSATGQATIYANASSGTANELDFTGSITDENLWFIQSGNDLKIDLLGSNTSVNVNNWFSGSTDQLQEITAGGLKIDSQISQLVQAMATYSTNNPGFDPTSSSNTTAPNDTNLQNAMASAWHA